MTGYISSIQPKPGTKFMNMIEGNTVNNLALVGKDKNTIIRVYIATLIYFMLMRIRDLKVQNTRLVVSQKQAIKLSTK